jgi:hypothetical protein
LNKKSGREFNTISLLLGNGCVEQSFCSQGQNFMLFKKFCAFYGTEKFIAVFITYRQQQYPGPDKATTYLQTLFIEDIYHYYLASLFRFFQVLSSLYVFRPK